MSIKPFLQLAMSTGRYSMSLADQCEQCFANRTANAFVIVDAVRDLENPENPRATRTKPAALFKGRMLKGLWHQHYFEATFLEQNVRNHWMRQPVNAFADVKLALDQKTAGIVAHRRVIDGFQERAANRELTGEWIIFARADARNYYLTLAMHTEPDELIWTRCKACAEEFPELAILAEER